MGMEEQTKLLGKQLQESPLWSDHVSVPARWLFICLLLRTDDKGEIVVDEDYRVCSEISGLGIQSAQRALTELEKVKMITAYDDDTILVHRVGLYRQRQTKSQARSAAYSKVWRQRKRTKSDSGDDSRMPTHQENPPQTPPSDSTTSTNGTSTSTVQKDSGSTTVEPSSKDEKPKKTDKQIREETGFNEFWDAYGKKTSTKTALTAWKNLTKRDREAAMGAVAAYVAATPDVRFRKNPSTWIHQRCWEDELVAPQKAPPREHIHEAGEIDF